MASGIAPNQHSQKLLPKAKNCNNKTPNNGEKEVKHWLQHKADTWQEERKITKEHAMNTNPILLQQLARNKKGVGEKCDAEHSRGKKWWTNKNSWRTRRGSVDSA